MMKDNLPIIHVALPAKNEFGFIQHTLACLEKQSLQGFHTWICVNQPDSYWELPEKRNICQNNQQTLELFKNYPGNNLHVLDKSSPGLGWQGKNLGVGIARKTIMDAIANNASDTDIIVSLDADTVFGENYLETVLQRFASNPQAVALANPYYHPLGNDSTLNRAILRYEIYMRYYALNMRLTGSPYCFTPLGSSMAAPVWAYKKINGLTPKKSGEDFYFLQKLSKTGEIMMYNTQTVYPSARLSDRVFFGTGPAMIKGIAGHWAAYPLFNPQFFQQVKETISLFPELFTRPCPTPMDQFLQDQFRCDDIFEALRINHKSPHQFVKACHEKIDGLRILQFLKINQASVPNTDEDNLRDFLGNNFSVDSIQKELETLNFSHSSVDNMNKIRNFLFETELKIQKEHAKNISNPL